MGRAFLGEGKARKEGGCVLGSHPLTGSKKCFHTHSSSRPLSGYPGLFVPRQVFPKPLGSRLSAVTSLACKVWSTWSLGLGPQGVKGDDPANMNHAVEAMALQGGVQ